MAIVSVPQNSIRVGFAAGEGGIGFSLLFHGGWLVSQLVKLPGNDGLLDDRTNSCGKVRVVVVDSGCSSACRCPILVGP